MRIRIAWTAGLFAAVLLLAGANAASAHGFAGKRFFPATLATDDPFVADELSLPSVSYFKTPATDTSPATRETDITFEFSKVIAPHFGVSVQETLIHLQPEGDQKHTGFGNVEIGGKYELLVNAPHETILSLGLNAEIGGTGNQNVGADSFSTLTPGLFYGKGFGDLPDGLAFLKPLALTGVVGVALPTRAKNVNPDDGSIDRNPHVLQWGFALEYSLPYLQSFVKDLGLPKPFSQLIPVVELNFQTPLDRGQGGKTTGTVNPGLIWAGTFLQLGVEAVIPINARTGPNVGVLGLVHFYLDDLFPKVFGRPIFGGRP
jgi:hypothetical protein